MAIGNSKLKGMTAEQREHLASCVTLLLLWVAASDGKVEESEMVFASSHFPGTAVTRTTNELLAIIRNADLGSIEKAIRAVAAESRELRTAFLDLAITMSMADRQIAITENHILRFYADALYLGIELLEKRFQAISGVPFSEPGDPGSQDWWDQVSQAGLFENPGNEEQPGSQMTIAQARGVLGVSSVAGLPEIERAYQSLADVFQADRVEAMGQAAVSLSNQRFEKIQKAYELLRVTK